MEKTIQDQVIIISVMIILSVLGGCLIGESNLSYSTVRSPQKVLSYNKLIDICMNKSIEISANCIMDQLKPFKKYKVIKDSVNLTFEELINNGGDCRDWSHLMIQIGNDYNITTYKLSFPARNGINHAVSQWSNHEGYCVFDIYEYICISYVKEDKNNGKNII